MQPTAKAKIGLQAAAALAGLCAAIWPGPAAAYRPFNGTDAAVADPNEMEDVAVRHALANGRPVNEIRLGSTFGFVLEPMIAGRH